jgi:polysaccharide deacetylase family protein (PEP-CTERM system associated)
MMNAMSVDLEDWFCANNLGGVIRREDWDKCELRVLESAERILDLLEKYNTHATFFVLGWIAERVPSLINEIEKRGHEIALHGYGHRLLTHLTPREFDEDLTRALDAVRSSGIKQEILGFRAPSFTVVKSTLWALDILEKHKIKYDSSIFPVGFHPDYGIPDSPLGPYKITEHLYEFPLSSVDILGMRLPCSGGGYFRLLPYAYTKYCVRKCNASGRPLAFYIHPWEFDSGQPRMALPWSKKIRHYHNLDKTEKRFENLLRDFQFRPIREILGL